ncbi:MAG: hypothetical protein RR614_06440 [Eubacterium sp.]
MEDFKSEYYTDLKETMEKYDISEDAVQFAAEPMQSLEEMFFGFANYLIS